ncbi:MAG TPA: 50S ribosomal protein L3 [Bacillota bacterium]|nr:50S ribosomal protein L3 [Bacillota bacterium]
MTKGILGRKIGMTQVFTEDGEAVPVTVVEAEPNVVLQVKTKESDGYAAIQLGVADKKEVQRTKPEEGHAEKANTNPKRYVREIRDANVDEYEVGQEVSVEVFEVGEKVDVTGTSKGKGYQGAVKRHGYAKGPSSHGSRFHRSPGSLGAVDPGRVFKGTKLPGRMGGEQVTIQNLEVVKVDVERNAILIKGNIPGAKKSFVTIKSARKGN